MQDDFGAVGNVVGYQGGKTDSEIDVVTVRQFLGYTRGQLLPLQPCLVRDRGACSHGQGALLNAFGGGLPGCQGTTRDT